MGRKEGREEGKNGVADVTDRRLKSHPQMRGKRWRRPGRKDGGATKGRQLRSLVPTYTTYGDIQPSRHPIA